jgi:hypothetical protein
MVRQTEDTPQGMTVTKPKRGRPPADIDLVQLEALCQIGATNEEIAAHFGVSERTIENRAKGAGFRAAMDRGIARGNLSLRRKQMQMALAGDRVMLIWLGKQRLGQQDKVEHSGNVEGGAPPNIHVNFISPAATKPAGDEGQQN